MHVSRRNFQVVAALVVSSACLHGSSAQAQYAYDPNHPPYGNLYYGQPFGMVNSVSGPLPLNLPPGQLTIGSTVISGQGQGLGVTDPFIGSVGMAGSLTTTTNGIATPAILAGMAVNEFFQGPPPPPKTDYYYFLSESTVNLRGTLAPNTTLSFVFDDLAPLVGGGGTGHPGLPPDYQFLYTDSTPGEFSKTFVIDRMYLGDWFAFRQFGGFFGVSMSFSVTLAPTNSQLGIFGTSTVNFDPVIGVAASTSLSAVPEPSSLTLVGLAGAIGTAVAAWRRRKSAVHRPSMST